MNFAALPNLIALSILVAVFWAISRKSTSQQVQLWLVGWALILLHFASQFPVFGDNTLGRVATAVGLGTLILASVAFLISVSAMASDRRSRILLATAIGVPTLAYTNGLIWGIGSANYYYLLIAMGVLAPLAFFWRYNQRERFHVAFAILTCAAAAGAAAWGVAKGNPGLGITVMLAALNFAAAFLYWTHHKRTTAGVLTTVIGFALWGAVFPTALLLQILAPSAKVESEVWNIPKYLVAVGMILTLLEDQIERSTYLAYHDELTDLPNRRLLEDRLDRALAQAERSRGKVAVFVLDLDHFKEVNDSFGHRVGDIALREVVARLASRIRASDTLARSGGDEFTVVSEVANRDGACTLRSTLETALCDPILVDGHKVRTGLSIGVALYPDDGRNADQLHAAADRAMYIAKRAGRKSCPTVLAIPQNSV